MFKLELLLFFTFNLCVCARVLFFRAKIYTYTKKKESGLKYWIKKGLIDIPLVSWVLRRIYLCYFVCVCVCMYSEPGYCFIPWTRWTPLYTLKQLEANREWNTNTRFWIPSAAATAINNSKCKCLIESARLIDLNPEIENNTQTPILYHSTLPASLSRSFSIPARFFRLFPNSYAHTCIKTHRPFSAKNRHWSCAHDNGTEEEEKNG